MNSYWIESTKENGKFNKLDKDISCDVCIIGAGMFGLTTAYYLSKKRLSVVILDKSEIGVKASGHTTAKITSQHGLIYDYLIHDFGINIAKKYLNANEEAIKNIKQIIDEENIECDFEIQSNFIYAAKSKELEKMQREIKALNSLDFEAQFIEHIPVPFENTGGIMFPNQANFHPRKYMLGLCDCILKNNGQIFTNTTVSDVKNIGNLYTTITKNYTINSKYVVLASHYPIINFPGFYFTKMYQDTSYVIGIDTKSEPFDGMYISSKTPTYSYRWAKYEDKKLLLIGGAGHKTGEENITESSTYEVLEQKAKELYPNSEVLYRWNTRDCITLDKVPYISEFSSMMPNIYIGTGFNKWGMTSSNVAANIITDKILGIKNKYEEAFTSTRLKPIKNRWEMKDMLKQVANSLVVEKLKIPAKTLNDIENDNGKIIEINGHTIGIYKDPSGKIFAVKPTCSHLGCSLSWNKVDKTWDCPCHGSRFDYTGKNLYDPAIKDLEIYNL